MSALATIAEVWRGPGAALRRRLGQGEGSALALTLGACAVIFVAQWPRLARLAETQDEIPLGGLIAGALFGWLGLAPLLIYVIAAASHLVAKVFGGKGSFSSARLALALALFACAPLWLLHGLAAGLAPGAALTVLGALTLGAFLFLWFRLLKEAET